MQTNAPETQGMANPKSRATKHENVIEQPGNTTNTVTILLDVISESL